MQSTKQRLSKAAYQAILLAHLDDVRKKEGARLEEVKAIVDAYEKSRTQNFEFVEVVGNGDSFTFTPILLEQ
ncbi:hypothetical protein ACIL2N_000330 [Vibrio metschnikovii]